MSLTTDQNYGTKANKSKSLNFMNHYTNPWPKEYRKLESTLDCFASPKGSKNGKIDKTIENMKHW